MPIYGYAHQHTYECVTTNFLKYMKEECLVFKVFGYPDVKKKEIKGKGKKQAA